MACPRKAAHLMLARKERKRAGETERQRDREKTNLFSSGKPPVTHSLQLGPTPKWPIIIPSMNMTLTIQSLLKPTSELCCFGEQAFNTRESLKDIFIFQTWQRSSLKSGPWAC
jgi:hypothetical protein